MTMNERQIKDIISESIKKHIAEQHIKQTIKQMVRESLENFGGFSQYESSDEEDGRLSDMNTESDNEAETRDSIENFFKQPGVNNAPYAYKLYGIEAKEGQDTNDMKNARKKFADCVNHEKNENGYPYSFSSDELNTLKGMISSNQLDEAIDKAMNKVLNEIGDTPRGQFALGAVAGRAEGRMSYHNDKYVNPEQYSKLFKTSEDAKNKAWDEIKDLDIDKYRNMRDAYMSGDLYGFDKGKVS